MSANIKNNALGNGPPSDGTQGTFYYNILKIATKQCRIDDMPPTKRQRDLLNFIQKFIDAHGYPPSYREIKDGLGYTSLGTVSQHIDALVERNILQKKYNYGRTLEIVGADELRLKEHIKKYYKKASKTEKLIIIKALMILGFSHLTNDLK